VGSLDFEGRKVAIEDGDSVASALYRAGVRTFTRSLKYHRRRGLYCMSGDCPNCLVTVDGEPGCRACTTAATDRQRVERASGWPSTERDVLSVLDRMHALIPVGFYYKVFIRPRWAWELAEKVIRRHTGVGDLPVGRARAPKPSRFAHVEVLVIGGGAAGLEAAVEAATGRASVMLCDEGRLGEKLPPGAMRDRVASLEGDARAAGVEILEGHTAVGIYEGPLVPLVGETELVQVRPARVVVATGAVETHAVFPGNDLPGVWLGRGAARMAGAHGVAPGSRAVVVAASPEGLEHLATLESAGVAIAAVVVPSALHGAAPATVQSVIVDGAVVGAQGRRALASVRVASPEGEETIACDALVLSMGLAPRDGLVRMSDDPAVSVVGDAAGTDADNALAEGGYVCLCEDVGVADLEAAWAEGWRSSEILKRYTTATMGPCQGALCGRHLAAFARRHEAAPPAAARTTSRPPARPVRLEDLAGGVSEVIEKRTALHDTHRSLGALLDWSGSWKRPYRYGDAADEYRAVRERVSLMDVSTLGKFLVGGRDATTLVDRVFPTRVRDLDAGRSRYTLALDEAGYVIDDGLICALGTGTDAAAEPARRGARFSITSTSGGADAMDAWLRNWADRWDLHVHVVDQTAMLGAINVAGPMARELLERLTNDDVSSSALPYPGHGEREIAGVPCRVIRVGFVGELSFELHHPRSRSVELWDELMRAGEDLGIRPHGLDALDVLRMEKGHIYLGQDALPDDHPAKLGLGWAVAMDKESFLGKPALERMSSFPKERKLVGLEFDATPPRGVPLMAGGEIVGRVTSCARSQALGRAIGLGWLRAVDGEFPTDLRAGAVTATVVPTPFYDPEGARVRG
jgi:sarcosine oxidase, subunit alpha